MMVPNPHLAIQKSAICEYCGHSWPDHFFQSETKVLTKGVVLCSTENCECPLIWSVDTDYEAEFTKYIDEYKADKGLSTLTPQHLRNVFHDLLQQNPPFVNVFRNVVAPLHHPPANVLTYHLNGAVYHFYLPVWWNEIQVDMPGVYESEEDIHTFIKKNYGADTGTSTTWQKALKSWGLAYSTFSRLPIYIGHCFSAGGEHQEAVKIYSELFELSQLHSESNDWNAVLLPFHVGKEYLALGQPSLAIQWFAKAAKFQNSLDSAIKHYAVESQKTIDYLTNRTKFV